MKNKVVYGFIVFCLSLMYTGCGQQDSTNEETEKQAYENDLYDSSTADRIEPETEESTDFPETSRYPDENQKEYPILQGEQNYQIVLYYKSEKEGAFVSHADIVMDNQIVQEINFEALNAKEHGLEHIQEMATYLDPISVQQGADFITIADYNFDGKMDFMISQDRFAANQSSFLYLWSEEGCCFEFEMRLLYLSYQLNEETKQLELNVSGGKYPETQYYKVKENGHFELDQVNWETWSREDLEIESSMWIYIENDGSIPAGELISNEKSWEEMILWEMEIEAEIDSWDSKSAREIVYFTIEKDSRVRIVL